MITKKRIRKVFAPLTVTVSTITSGTLSQIYESMFDRWTPNRQTEPFVITPLVTATTDASDNSWVNGNNLEKNAKDEYSVVLGDIEWYANGELISNVSTLEGKYSIEMAGAERGKLTITKNLNPSEQYDLVMRAKFLDKRDGTYTQIITDPVSIGVTEKTANEWDLSVTYDNNIFYHPLFDRLKEYDWKVANGKMTASEEARKVCLDGNEYLRHLPIVISRGSYIIDESDRDWDNVSIELSLIKDGISYAYGVSTNDNLSFVTALDKHGIDVDLRFVPAGTVMEVVLKVEGQKMGSEFLTFGLVIDNYSVETTNEGDIDVHAPYRYDKVLCSCNGRVMPYPEAYLDIQWFTTSLNATEVPHGTGECVSIDMSKVKLGTGSDCWMDVYVKTLVKTQTALIAVDDEGKVYLMDNKGKAITNDILLN